VEEAEDAASESAEAAVVSAEFAAVLSAAVDAAVFDELLPQAASPIVIAAVRPIARNFLRFFINPPRPLRGLLLCFGASML
jgi:hypothetical protein